MASSYRCHRWIAQDLTATKLEGRMRIHPQTPTTFPLLRCKMMAFAVLPYVGWAGQPAWLYMALSSSFASQKGKLWTQCPT